MAVPKHHPPHIYLDDTWYIVTSSIYQHAHLLNPAGHKELVREHLKQALVEFGIQLKAWVILDNHSHLLLKTKRGRQLGQFFQRWHGRTSFELNGRDNTRGRQVWHNYWDTCIRSDQDFWTRFNYIHHNPVKHGYVTDSRDWQFSSYQYYLEHKREEWLMAAFRQYPIVDFTDPQDDF